MENNILSSENFYRLSFFVGGLVVFWALGLIYQYRATGSLDRWRWINNLGLVVFNSFLVRIAFPLTLVAFAVSNEYGLLHYFEAPLVLNIIVSLLVLDLIIYWQHVLFHRFPLLWRLHAVHHSDPGFDVTTENLNPR